MLLKNNSKRLITLNIPVEVKEGEKPKHQGIQIKPGNNPAVEIDEELGKSKFVRALVKSGDLIVVLDEDNDGETEDDLSSKTKVQLIEIAEMMDLEVSLSMNKSEIIALINGESE